MLFPSYDPFVVGLIYSIQMFKIFSSRGITLFITSCISTSNKLCLPNNFLCKSRLLISSSPSLSTFFYSFPNDLMCYTSNPLSYIVCILIMCPIPTSLHFTINWFKSSLIFDYSFILSFLIWSSQNLSQTIHRNYFNLFFIFLLYYQPSHA